MTDPAPSRALLDYRALTHDEQTRGAELPSHLMAVRTAILIEELFGITLTDAEITGCAGVGLDGWLTLANRAG